MKELKRLKVSQLTNFQDLSVEEMMQMFGGKGCCWEVMAAAYKQMYASEYGNDKFKNSACFTASYYEQKWKNYMTDETDPSGDPLESQSQDLFNFMKNNFFSTTTASGFETTGYDNMMTTSGAKNYGSDQLGIGFMDSGNGKDLHAVLLKGFTTDASGNKVYKYWDPETGSEYTTSAGGIKSATGLYRKE